jgi:hypothetical protein
MYIHGTPTNFRSFPSGCLQHHRRSDSNHSGSSHSALVARTGRHDRGPATGVVSGSEPVRHRRLGGADAARTAGDGGASRVRRGGRGDGEVRREGDVVLGGARRGVKALMLLVIDDEGRR